MRQSLGIAAMVAAVSLLQSRADLNFPLGTYVYRGSVMNYRHEVYSSGNGLTVEAVATNGTVLASCRVTDPVSSGVNYVLEVPVSSQASAKSAAIGDELTCVVRSDGGQTSVSTKAMPPVAAANAITNMNLMGSSSTAFPYGPEGGSVLVSDDYLAGLAPWMQAYGKDAYDPAADWDGDGASNYSEYLAGTNPFDPSDRLRILDYKVPVNAPQLLTFEYAGGHLYAIDSSPSLTNKAWKATSFRTDPAAKSGQTTVWFGGSEDVDVGTATIYLAPAADSPSMFYTIRAE